MFSSCGFFIIILSCVFCIMASILKYKGAFTLTVICGWNDSLSMRATGTIVEKVEWHVNNQ